MITLFIFVSVCKQDFKIDQAQRNFLAERMAFQLSSTKPINSISGKREYVFITYSFSSCIFWPIFVCCPLHRLVEICSCHIFLLERRKNKKIYQKNSFWVAPECLLGVLFTPFFNLKPCLHHWKLSQSKI